jgi:hypothetical protein
MNNQVNYKVNMTEGSPTQFSENWKMVSQARPEQEAYAMGVGQEEHQVHWAFLPLILRMMGQQRVLP